MFSISSALQPMTTSFKFVFRKSNGDQSKDPWGYIYQLTIQNREKSYKSIGLPRIRKSQWDPVKEKVRKGVGVDVEKFNGVINESKKDYLNRGGKIKYSSGLNNRSSFVDYMERAIIGARLKDKHGTRLKYQTVLRKLKSYLRDRNLMDLSFYDLDIDFLYDFQSYMLDTGMTQNSTTHYLKIIKSFVRRSFIDREMMNTNDPFMNFKFAKKEVKLKETLNREEIQLLMNAHVENSDLNYIRAMFLFQFFSGGMRVSDLLTLRYRNLINGRISYKMFKTKSLIDFKVTETLLSLISILISYEFRDVELEPDELNFELELKKRQQKFKEDIENEQNPPYNIKSSAAIPDEVIFVEDEDLVPFLMLPPSIDSFLESLSEKELKRKRSIVQKFIDNMGKSWISRTTAVSTSLTKEKLPVMERLREKIQKRLDHIKGEYYRGLIDRLTELGTNSETRNNFICNKLDQMEFVGFLDREDFSHIPDHLYQRINKTAIVYNRDLKKLQKHLGFEKTLKSHLPRTSFTNIMMMGDMNHRDISNTLGHSSISITDEYLKTGFKNDGVDTVIKRTSESFEE